MKIKCDICGKTFRPGNNALDGMPNGVALVLQSGKKVTYCHDCICLIGNGVIDITQNGR